MPKRPFFVISSSVTTFRGEPARGKSPLDCFTYEILIRTVMHVVKVLSFTNCRLHYVMRVFFVNLCVMGCRWIIRVHGEVFFAEKFPSLINTRAQLLLFISDQMAAGLCAGFHVQYQQPDRWKKNPIFSGSLEHYFDSLVKLSSLLPKKTTTNEIWTL